MTLTLLLDLDDTLLGNDMNVFGPAYLQSLSKFLASYVAPERLLPTLMAATQQMLQNNRLDRSLKQTFDAVFYPALGLDPEAMQAPLATFYAEVFPTLRGFTQPHPEAVHVVEQALQRGYQIAIATNPLFPLTAITQRLSWAGLSPQDFPFKLIPSYETASFAKPNPTFFAEILALLGWPDGPVLMVGDDPYYDIEPSARFGLASYWISPKGDSSTPPQAAKGFGSLKDLLPWIDASSEDQLQPDYDHPTAYLATLRATPPVLSHLALEFSDSTWPVPPPPEEWGLTEIICHLRDVDGEVNLPRLKKVLTEANPFMPGIDTDQWAEQRHYVCQDSAIALDNFKGYRLELVSLLEKLKPEEWQLPARHAIFGPTQVKELVSIIAAHDRLHIRQAHKLKEALIPSTA